MPELGTAAVKEFVALAKANPDKFNAPAAPGRGAQAARGPAEDGDHPLPRRGDALKALLSGTVQLSSGVLAPAQAPIKNL
jgi:hypothetical protein